MSSPASAVALRAKQLPAVTAACPAQNIHWGWGQAGETFPHIEAFEAGRSDLAAQDGGPIRAQVHLDIAAKGKGALSSVNAIADALEAELVGTDWEHEGRTWQVVRRLARHEIPGNPIVRVQLVLAVIRSN